MTDDHVIQRFLIPSEAGMQFAHGAMLALISLSNNSDGGIRWTDVLVNGAQLTSAALLLQAAEAAIQTEHARALYHIHPSSLPDFLQRQTEEGS